MSSNLGPLLTVSSKNKGDFEAKELRSVTVSTIQVPRYSQSLLGVPRLVAEQGSSEALLDIVDPTLRQGREDGRIQLYRSETEVGVLIYVDT